MTVLAHNLYRLFARNLNGYSHCEAKTLFKKFILNAGEIKITKSKIEVKLKRKRTLPLTLEYIESFGDDTLKFPWLFYKQLQIKAANFT